MTKETTKKMSIRRLSLGLLGVLSALALFVPTTSAAGPAAAWRISSLATPTNFAPGDTAHRHSYEVIVTNVGAEETDGTTPVMITDTLPEGVALSETESSELRILLSGESFDVAGYFCSANEPEASVVLTCTVPGEYLALHSGEFLRLYIPVEIPAAPGNASAGDTLINRVEVSGGGAVEAATDSERTEASFETAEPGLAYFEAAATGEDGKPAGQAASHPYQYTFDFAFNSKPGRPGGKAEFVPAGGTAKDLRTVLPRGLIGDPSSTPKCTPAQFRHLHDRHEVQDEQVNECPDGSAVGYVLLRRLDTGFAGLEPLYNLVPPPGEPAQFGFFIPGSFVDVLYRHRSASRPWLPDLRHRAQREPSEIPSRGRGDDLGRPGRPGSRPAAGGMHCSQQCRKDLPVLRGGVGLRRGCREGALAPAEFLREAA